MQTDLPLITYSSYTKGLYHYTITHSENYVGIRLNLPLEYEKKIAKRIAKFPEGPVLPLNGIAAHELKVNISEDAAEATCKIEALFLESLTSQKVSVSMRSVNKAARATATRDLADLVEKGALVRSGQLRSTRYWLPFTSQALLLQGHH